MTYKQFMFDAYPIEDDSDQEYAESSDDDIDVLLHGSLNQRKRRLHNKQQSCNKSSSDDEFEKEMKAELNSTMKKIETNCANTALAAASTSDAVGIESKLKYYDNEYFDSDSDEEQSSTDKKTVKRLIPSNDDLLYDPNMDDDDQKWVDRLRGRYQPAADNSRLLPTSDAILNCPCCMISLCMDCQRHAIYQHQYRAMFVMNCVVKTDQVLRFPPASEPKNKKKKGKQYKSDITVDTQSDETYHPVKCSDCNTEVGVYDSDEVYHFFNVLASHS